MFLKEVNMNKNQPYANIVISDIKSFCVLPRLQNTSANSSGDDSERVEF